MHRKNVCQVGGYYCYDSTGEQISRGKELKANWERNRSCLAPEHVCGNHWVILPPLGVEAQCRSVYQGRSHGWDAPWPMLWEAYCAHSPALGPCVNGLSWGLQSRDGKLVDWLEVMPAKFSKVTGTATTLEMLVLGSMIPAIPVCYSFVLKSLSDNIIGKVAGSCNFIK